MRTDIWKPEEIKFLLDNNGSMPVTEMSRQLKRSSAAIRTKLCRIGGRVKPFAKWSRSETLFLESNADRMMAKNIAAHLGRTTSSVLGKASHLGIRFTSNRKTHSDEDVRLCIALHADGMSIPLIAEKMEMSIHTVKSFIYRSHRGYRELKQSRQG